MRDLACDLSHNWLSASRPKEADRFSLRPLKSFSIPARPTEPLNRESEAGFHPTAAPELAPDVWCMHDLDL